MKRRDFTTFEGCVAARAQIAASMMNLNLARLFTMTCLLFAVPPADAAPASRKDFDDFTGSLFGSYIHSNPSLVLEYCEKARAKAARFDPNAGWVGLVMNCLGHVEAIQKRKETACTYFATAIDSFKKARPRRYEIRWVSNGLKRTMRYRASLGC